VSSNTFDCAGVIDWTTRPTRHEQNSPAADFGIVVVDIDCMHRLSTTLMESSADTGVVIAMNSIAVSAVEIDVQIFMFFLYCQAALTLELSGGEAVRLERDVRRDARFFRGTPT